jgi:hypothetical protein
MSLAVLCGRLSIRRRVLIPGLGRLGSRRTRAADVPHSLSRPAAAVVSVTIQTLKPRLISLIVAVILISTALTVLSRRRSIRNAERETLALDIYSKALQPGMTRKEVEEYLHSKNIRFGRTLTAYGERRESQWADLVEIEEEATCWFCFQEFVSVALEFAPMNPPGLPEDTDILQRIEIHRVTDGP